ncbi:MAG TPA: BamA/TamA family outer membrane protein, partial [Cytophagaceae bacterium]
DINLINTANISDTFQVFLEALQQQGNNIITSFRSSYVSDIFANYIYTDFDPSVVKKAKYKRYYLESGGTLFNFLSVDSIFGLQTFSYLKANTDYRYYFPVNRRSTLAFRINLGAAYPLSISTTLPYEKYFFAGGTNSVRAWQPRRLGPGSYAPLDEEGEINYRFERPGELLLESSLEYRFPIIGFFEGATFIDLGNVWMLTKDNSRPGAEFKPSGFLSEIAVGTGVGLRLNLSFLVLRLDLGIKAYDPALKSFAPFNKILKDIVLNIGIGYPF